MRQIPLEVTSSAETTAFAGDASAPYQAILLMP